MWKALCNPRTAIKLCRCQQVLPKAIKITNNRIHYLRPDHFKYKVKLQNCLVNGSNVPPVQRQRSSSDCTSVVVDDGDSVNDGIEEILDESHEGGFIQIKEFLYEHLPDDDSLFIKISNCNSEDSVSIISPISIPFLQGVAICFCNIFYSPVMENID